MRHAHAHSLDAVRETARKTLGELADAVRRRHPELQVSARVVDGEAREALTGAADAAGLLVVGARGSGGFPGLVVGSTSLHVAATARCPLVVVPEGRRAADHVTEGIAVGVDAREPEDPVLGFAFEAADRTALPLRVAHAWRYPLVVQGHATPPMYEQGHVEAEEERLLAEVLAGWRQRFPEVAVRPESVRSGAARELVALSANERLVVVGRRGSHAGPLGRLGSVSLAVVQNALCPVAVVPLS
jgi:nucleotide-binding universal stress UspA family protein